MQIIVKDSTARWGQVLTQEQFNVVHDHIVACMNNGKRIKDEDIILMLSKADKPISFLGSVLLDVALYEDRPIMAFLGGWLGSDVAHNEELYMMARDLLTDEELSEFDMRTDEETQRTFLAIVGVVNGAYPL